MVDLSARSSCGGLKAQPAEPGATGLGVCGLCPRCLPALFWKTETFSPESAENFSREHDRKLRSKSDRSFPSCS